VTPAIVGGNVSTYAQAKALVRIMCVSVIAVIQGNFVKASVVNMGIVLMEHVNVKGIGKEHIANAGGVQVLLYVQEMVYVTVHYRNVIAIQDGKVLTVVNLIVLVNLTVTHVACVFHIPRVLNALIAREVGWDLRVMNHVHMEFSFL
jgi:nitrogen regulatory protein PII